MSDGENTNVGEDAVMESDMSAYNYLGFWTNIANGNNLTFYINGTKVRELRGQAPKGSWRFGLSGDNFDKDNTARVVFKTVKVTN